jgi:short-subunit dehydrogenase
MKKTLKEKVVFITGASHGFGADAARLFAKQGCRVVLAARNMDRLKAEADQIQAEGGQALVVSLDVRVQSQIDAAVKTVLEHYGRIDVLFNNAGHGRHDWLERLDPSADIDNQINTNLRGLIQLTWAVLPIMLSQREGMIINMSSVAGLIAPPTYAIYSATKYGVRGFTDSLRREVAMFGVHVCGIYPGPAKTDFSDHSGDTAVKRHLRVPDWLYMSSEYVARRVVGLVRHPRRALVIPWYYHLVVGLDTFFPGLVDWLLKILFVKRFHKLEE